MLASPILRAAGGPPGFWRRSMEELKRQTGIAIRMEGIHGPTHARPLISFDEPGSVDRCKVMTDGTSFGGFSTASLTHVPGRAHDESSREADAEPAHALFRGSISTELPPNRPEIQRSGFAAWRTRDRGYSLFGKLLWDIDPYAYLLLRFKSDGRKYFINIQTESIIPTDIHQHLLPTFAPGQWETVTIPFNAFVRTNHGTVVEPQKEMLRQKVKSIGIGLIDRVSGPFELRIANLHATNKEHTANVADDTGFDLGLNHKNSRDRSRIEKKEPEKILI